MHGMSSAAPAEPMDVERGHPTPTSWQLLLVVHSIVAVVLWSAGGLCAQAMPIGTIDYYGLRTVSQQAVSQVLGVAVGDTLEWSGAWRRFQPVLERLEITPGIAEARVTPICCWEGKISLFVGIREEGAASFAYHPAPDSALALPQEIAEVYQSYGAAQLEAYRTGNSGVDHSQGHMLSANPEARAFEERFLVFAEGHQEELRQILRHAADAEHRQIAAWVIAYADDKRAILDDLIYATRDPDKTVRNNAMRALAVIVESARDRPEFEQISPAPFIDMLNSVDWTDRNKATMLLTALTEKGDAALLQQLREQALPSLVEMALWQSVGHAYAPFRLLGRVAGLSEQEIGNAWARGEQDKVIARVVESSQIGE